MSALPASIEASLAEAGFSLTEILVIRRLMEEDGLSIRALSSGTGKGMGAVDQAVKKLIKKEIVSKEWINDNYKYVFRSLGAVSKWVVEDLKKKRDALQRKHQDFETFISTLKMDKKRPEMEHYHGEDGIKKLYIQLLEAGKEQLNFFPVTVDPELDPLREFRSDYAKTRRSRGVTSRVITSDTPLGRRFQTRDPFEHRKTLLIPADQYQFDFEKIISGDTVTCINHTEKRGCSIHYPELACMERSMFESLWKLNTKAQAVAEVVETAGGHASPLPLQEAPAPAEELLKQKVASRVREFLWSKESLINFAVFFVIAAAVTFGVYKYDQYTNFQRLREKAMSVAATGALQFSSADLDQIHTLQDVSKPEYAKVIRQLNDIRYQNQWVKYMYILRPTGQKDIFEFVADADSLDPLAHSDMNRDGIIDDAEENSAPGTSYDMSQIQSVISANLDTPTSTTQPFTDQWGTFISGFAPIKNGSGTTAAILGVDIFSSQLEEFTLSPLALAGIFFGLFFLLVLVRLTAFNRLLMQQVWQLLRETKWPVYAGFAGLFLASLVFFYFYTSHLNLQRIKEQVLSIALTGANQFDANDLNQLQVEEDWKKPEWAKTVTALQKIRDGNNDIKYTYIFRKDPSDPTRLLFISDATSLDPYANVDANPHNDVDLNQDGKVTEVDFLPWPGQPWPGPPQEAFVGFDTPVTTDVFTDQWGPVISGYVPIKNTKGITVAVLAIDIWADKLERLNAGTVWAPLIIVLSAILLFIFLKLAKFHHKFLVQFWKAFELKKLVISVLFFTELAFFVTLFFYYYTLNTLKNEIGTKLMTIAATAAPEFVPEDLAQLHLPRDMRKEAYQRVFRKLNEMRDQNKGVKFAYIYRFVQRPNVYEFIADADSNYDLSFLKDFNGDGILGKEDENVAPGVRYVPINESVLKNALDFPTYTRDFDDSQWGHLISGTAPIRDKTGRAIAFVGVDMEVEEFYQITRTKFISWLWFIAIFVVLLCVRYFSARI